MKRRNFIKTISVGISSLTYLAHQQEQTAERLGEFERRLNGETDESGFWEVVRRQFEISPEIIHLNCGSIGACPKIVTDALNEFSREIEKDPYRNVFGDGLHEQLESVRDLAANMFNATTAEIAITRNTTEGMNTISRGLSLQAGDEVLTTNHEHPGGMACWQYLARRAGIKVVILELPGTVIDSSQVMERLRKNISPRTKVFSFCHVDTITGFVMPIADIAREAKQRDVFLVCDGAQAPGMLNVDVKKLGVDAYVSSSHKWMLAPKGSGLLYINRDSQPRVDSLELSSGFNVYSATSGTRNVAGILAHGVAIQFHQTIGSDKIANRVRKLNQYLGAKLDQLTSLRRITSDCQEYASGMVTFAIDRKMTSSPELATRLRDDLKIYVKPVPATYGLVPAEVGKQEDYNAIRFSTHIFNSEEQIDRAVDAISRLLNDK